MTIHGATCNISKQNQPACKELKSAQHSIYTLRRDKIWFPGDMHAAAVRQGAEEELRLDAKSDKNRKGFRREPTR